MRHTYLWKINSIGDVDLRGRECSYKAIVLPQVNRLVDFGCQFLQLLSTDILGRTQTCTPNGLHPLLR